MRSEARGRADQQLTFIETETETVIGLSAPRPPGWLLPRKNARQPIKIVKDAAVDGLLDRKQASLMRQELADGDLSFAVPSKLGPVRNDSLLVVEPTVRMGDCQSHGRRPLVAE